MENLLRAHLNNLAQHAIPAILEHFERNRNLFAKPPKLPPHLDDILKLHLAGMTDDMRRHLERAYRRNGLKVLREFRIGADVSHIVDPRAIRYARDRAAELVVNLSETTRNMVHGKVVDALEEGWSAGRLANELRDSDAFSPARSLNIARTETMEAYRAGGREAAKVAGAGQRRWDAGEGACEDCEENAAVGWIGMDDDYPNGDSIHPSCRCNEQFREEPVDEESEAELE